VAGIGSLTTIWQFLKYRETVKTFFTIGILILLIYAVFDVVQARRFTRSDGRALAEQALAPITAGAPARTYGLKNTQRQFLVSMLTRRSVPSISTLSALKEWISLARGDAYVVAEAHDANEILTNLGLSAESYASFCLEKRDMKVVRFFIVKTKTSGIKNGN
jgi:hypothetical protein